MRLAENASFPEVHVELLADVEPGTWVVDCSRRGGARHHAVDPRGRTRLGFTMVTRRTGEFPQAMEDSVTGLLADPGDLRKLVAYEHALAGRTTGG